MKTRISAGWIFGMALAAAVVTSGFGQENLNPPPKTVSPVQPGPAVTVQGTSVVSNRAPAAAAIRGKAANESPALKTPLSNWSREIQELTRAGVDERVILTYITNSAGIFNLNPDQIIYLKNAGVSPQVITVMIQHDQTLMPSAPPMTAAISPAIPFLSSPAPDESQTLASDDSWLGEPWDSEENFNPPEQPDSTGPVRVPYTVKLNDPIIMLKLPSFTVPWW
jgi:hypothetical protein